MKNTETTETMVITMTPCCIYELLISGFVKPKQQSCILFTNGDGFVQGHPRWVRNILDTKLRKNIRVQIREELEDDEGTVTFGRIFDYLPNENETESGLN